MRVLYPFCLSIALGMGLIKQGHCQTLPPDTATFSATDERRVSSNSDSAGTCSEVLRWGSSAGLVRVYYPSGHLQEYVPYADLANDVRHGTATSWYESGQMRAWQTYQQGKRDGTLLIYYEDGRLKRQTQYVAGTELPGSCFDQDGQAIPYFPYEQVPLYPGGQIELAKEVTKSLRWRPRFGRMPLIGSIYVGVNILIGRDGRVQGTHITVSSRMPELDQAVLDAIAKLTRSWVPARRDGQPVASHYLVPVEFTTSSRLQTATRP